MEAFDKFDSGAMLFGATFNRCPCIEVEDQLLGSETEGKDTHVVIITFLEEDKPCMHPVSPSQTCLNSSTGRPSAIVA